MCRKTVGGDDGWWGKAGKRYKKFKFSLPPKFRELNKIFDGYIGTPSCKYEVPHAPPPTSIIDVHGLSYGRRYRVSHFSTYCFTSTPIDYNFRILEAPVAYDDGCRFFA